MTVWNGAWRCNVCSARYSESGWNLTAPPVCPVCRAQDAQPIDYENREIKLT
jgi:rubrerythrin